MEKATIVSTAIEIAEQYRDEYGLILTLRQMYYQFVARGHLPNGDEIYKRIGATLGEARLNGTFPISFLEDRGRSVGSTAATKILSVNKGIEKVGEALSHMPWWLNYGRWHGQPTKVFVWIEKEALSGVLEGVCNELGVGLFACKGYPSISALAGWIEETHEMLGSGERALILYLGDHDPDGLQIPISAKSTMERIMDVEKQWFDFDIKRIALSLTQIRKYNPPPMVAKKSSARYAKYKEATGLDEAWELDALDPPVLQKLVRTEVGNHFDQSIFNANELDAKAKQVELIERVCDDPEWIERQLRKFI